VDQIGDTDGHASLGIEWQIFKPKASIEFPYSVVERMREDAWAIWDEVQKMLTASPIPDAENGHP
jgi:hypothetical protein